MKRNYVIPFFIPHKGCPERCVFCDQERISGASPDEGLDIESTVEKYLLTIPRYETDVEIGFFGGTFTSLPFEEQRQYLEKAEPFIREGKIGGIRISTRPDSIDDAKLLFLKGYSVKTIELGVQSMRDRVLSAVKRGYDEKEVVLASGLVIRHGFVLGHQMMVGLPQSLREDEYYTARKAVELGASEARIYPTVVIRGTELASWWQKGEYTPLTEDAALSVCADLILYFELNDVKVLRCGLHPSDGLTKGNELLAGPFHEAFRQKVESRIFGKVLDMLLPDGCIDKIHINPLDEAAFFGFRGENTVKLTIRGLDVRKCVVRDLGIERGGVFVATHGDKMLLSRKMIAKSIFGNI
ncbi:MAG: radical SAM protein [Candidatus Omnitrophica bacterium]|nr:radical SAM protein [Candidatus Omnitrophota bacterium]